MTSYKKIILTVAFTLIILQTLSPVRTLTRNRSASIIVVPDHCPTIQQAIDAANDGDTIQVRSGIYNETLSINKTLILIGEDPQTTTVNATSTGDSRIPAVEIKNPEAQNVKISNFTITGATTSWGIQVDLQASAWIENNIVTGNSGGVLIATIENVTLVNNTVISNQYEGILFLASDYNAMRNNTINNNSYNFGIIQGPFDHDIDVSNTVNGKPMFYLKDQIGLDINPVTYPEVGFLALINCSDITVENLTLQNNYNGLLLAGAENCQLRNNTITNNVDGLELISSEEINIQKNSITGNDWRGLALSDSPNNTLAENKLVDNLRNLQVRADALANFLQNIDTSNTVKGKPILYLQNLTDTILAPSTQPDTGYLALINSQNILAANFTLPNCELLLAFSQNCTATHNAISGEGIYAAHCAHVNITANTFTGGDAGISLDHTYNSMVAENNATDNTRNGVYLETSNNNVIVGNIVRNNSMGAYIWQSSNNSVVGNDFISSTYGVELVESNYNRMYHNNFINSTLRHAISSIGHDNVWDNGYPSGGNYWSDCNSTDLHSGVLQNLPNSDAVGDTVRNIEYSIEMDMYPLMGMYHDFPALDNENHHYEVISNSTVTNVGFAVWMGQSTPHIETGQRLILFYVEGPQDSGGFCRVTVPRDLLNGSYIVLFNGAPVSSQELPDSNSTHVYIYFSYRHSTHEVMITPEFPANAVLALVATLTALTKLIAKKLRKKEAS